MKPIKLNDDETYIMSITEPQYNIIEDVIKIKSKSERDEEFNKHFNMSINCMIAYGETSDVDTSLLRVLIPEETYPMQPRARHKSYKCYANSKPSIVMHEDLASSWNCLMSVMNNPKYCLIYKLNNDATRRVEKQSI